MIEVLLVLGFIALLSGAVWAPPALLFTLGVGGAAAGFALGVPAGFVYHVALHRALRAEHGSAPRGWLWRPVSFHADLAPEHRPAVLAWFYAGAAGFVLVIAGLASITVAVLRGYAPG